MPALNSITAEKLCRLVGTAGCPTIIDVRTDEAFAQDPRLIPGSLRRPADDPSAWAATSRDTAAVVTCRAGHERSHGVSAWLRHEGRPAEVLEGGVQAWVELGLPLVPEAKLPTRDAQGRTIWVTRARPKVDRIACPWLIRRFVDPSAVFLYVPPSEVLGVAERFGAAPFDIEGDGVVWSHRGERCTFDVMVEELGLAGFDALRHLARIVRGADTDRPNLAPEAAGLLAASLGLSRIYADDLDQLEAGLLLYDSFYRWCRDAVDETHNWTSHAPRKAPR